MWRFAPGWIGDSTAMLLNTSPRPTIAPPKLDALPPPLPRRAAHGLLRDPDAIDWELWRQAEEHAWADRRLLPGRIEAREYRRNRIERFSGSDRGTFIVSAGVDGQPDVRPDAPKGNDTGRPAVEPERRCAEWRATLLTDFLGGQPLLGWREAPPLRLGSSMIGGMVCRAYVVTPPVGESGYEYMIWIDEGTARVRRMGYRRTGMPWRDRDWRGFEREVAVECGPDSSGRWVPLVQHERTSYRRLLSRGELLGHVDRFARFGEHWEHAGSSPARQP